MATYISDYTTREDVEDQLEKADPGASVPAPVTAEYNEFVAYVDQAIHAVSQFISRYTGRVFVPYKDTQSYKFRHFGDSTIWHYSRYKKAYVLKLKADLLVTSSVTWDGTLLSATDYDEYDILPYHELHFDPNTLQAYGTDFSDSVDIVATWGYHDNTSQMYTVIDSSVTIDSSSTSLTVADAALYRTWQYIKIEDELLQIIARNESTEVLTVKRAVNGTSAAAHNSQSVSVFNPVDDIRLAATRLAAWAYMHRNELGTQLTLTDGSTIRNEVPPFVFETLDKLQRYADLSA